jgi:poly(3-hydroxybutyrate) depolymerase
MGRDGDGLPPAKESMTSMRALARLALALAPALALACSSGAPTGDRSGGNDDAEPGEGGSGGSGGTGGRGGAGGSGGNGGSGGVRMDAGSASDSGAPDDEPDPAPVMDAGATEVRAAGDAGAPASSPTTTTPSAACSMAAGPPTQGSQTMKVGALTRRYILRLPAAYDGKKPWPVIFAFHGAGNQDATRFDTGFGFKAANGDKAVLVFPEALPRPSGGRSWMIDTQANLAFMDALIEWLKANVCIDSSRLFATGQSSGGYFSQTLGCQRGHVFRAVAPSSGGIREFVNCMGNPGVWMSHGVNDSGTSKDVADAKKYWLENKMCTPTGPRPVDPSPCVEFQNCRDGVPFVFCEHNGGHPWPDHASKGVWTFFSRF